ncbi:MAG: entericidin [Armatimonadetes bacterium]|nr:entericidin [Akkermansiaceae bacterium]
MSIAALAASAFTSCNTTIGLGRDMRILGEGMENSANKQSGGTQDTSGAPVY